MNPFRKDDWKSFAARHWWKLFFAQAVFLFAVGAFTAWKFLPSSPSTETTGETAKAQDAGHQHGGDVAQDDTNPQWWTCAMHPQIRQPRPGKCPICQMELVPVQPSAGGLRTLTIKPAVRELMKVETAPVEHKYVTANVRMVGKVEFDETRLAHITAWVPGRLDRLYVDYTGVQVNEGDHMVYIYSEELYSIQEQLIQAIQFDRENPQSTGLSLAEAAREKLRLLGLTEQQIKEIEVRDRPEEHITIYSPASGIVIEKLRQIGDRVRTGDRIYTVADLTQVWVQLDAYESDLQWIRYGQEVSFTTDSYPGETFKGRIAFIDPVLDKETRTVKVRVNVPNSDGRLKPEMFVRATVNSNVAAGGRVLDAELAGKWISPMHPEIVKVAPGNCDVCGMPLVRAETLGYVPAETDPAAKPLVIPASAALVTGTRAIVYVEVAGAKEPTYEGREVLLGPRAGDYYLVRNGLHEGEMVVTNGNFKIDSALQIQAKPTMMTPEGGGGGGHDHGGEKPAASGDTNAPTTMTLPGGFTQQLHDLVAKSEQVQTMVKTNEIEKVKTAFKDFGDSLNRVNAEGLDDHPAMLWKEFLMLLGNDAIEGAEADDMQTALRVDVSLNNNIRRMREQFMLTHAGHGETERAEMPMLMVPAEFKSQLRAFADAYFNLQNALAADNAQDAGQAIAVVQASLNSLDDQMLDGATKDVWIRERQALEQIVARLGSVQEIEAARSEFVLLSEQLLAVTQRFGLAEITEVYELHCPMAFDGRGAIWLQNNDQARNPYYGAKMLTCADRIRKIEFHSSSEGPVDSHEKGHRE